MVKKRLRKVYEAGSVAGALLVALGVLLLGLEIASKFASTPLIASIILVAAGIVLVVLFETLLLTTEK